MIIFEVLNLAFTSLKANKVRSLLTMLGIIIGVSAVILLIALGNGLENYITQQFEDLGTNILYVLPGQVGKEGQSMQGPPNFAGSKLTLKDSRDIAKLGGSIVGASSSIEIPASVQYGNISKYVRVHGVEDNFFKMRNIIVETGRELTKADVEQQRKVVVIGPILKEKLFGEQKALGKKILIGDFRYEVVGITATKGGGLGQSLDDIPFITIINAQRQFNQESVQAISVEISDKQSIPDAKKSIEKLLLKRYKEDEFSVVDQASLIQTITQIIGVLTSALGGIAAISLVVGGIGIMNIMLVSVTERTKEIGLRKAVGAKFKDILFQFLMEAVMLCLVGGLVGVLLGAGGAMLARKLIPAVVPFWSVLLAFGFSAAVGIIFGVAPAYKAAKLDPITALRYE